jgi:membrane protein DedA with SNARE-associated domain
MSDFLLCWIVVLLAVTYVKGAPTESRKAEMLLMGMCLAVSGVVALVLYVVLWVIRNEFRQKKGGDCFAVPEGA